MKKIISQKINQINSRPIELFDWILLIVMSVFLFFTVFYADLIIIYDHSLTFLDSLFQGDIANFYANTLERPSYDFGAVYYWTPYAIEGIWCLPIYILEKLFSINTHAVGCYIWIKLGIALALVAAIAMLTSILRDFNISKEKIRFAQFFFASSFLVVLPVIAVAQIDIIAIFFMLWGLREYFKSEKITWKFLLIFSFAASLKTFALFVFLPLVFLKEKRILAAVWDVFVGLWWILVCVIPYAWRDDYKESTAILNDVMIERLFSTQLQAGNVDIPIFWAILVAICIWAYVTHVDGQEERFSYANWIALAVFAAFFIFVFSHPYWIVLIVPYLTMIITANDGSRKVNMILEPLISAGCMFVYFGKFGVYLKEINMNLMVLAASGHPTNDKGYLESATWMIKHGLDKYYGQAFAVFAVCLVAFLMINSPKKVSASWTRRQEETFTFDHGMIYVRQLMLLVYILAYLYIGYIA